MAMIMFATGLPSTTNAQSQRCFPETTYCITGSIRTYWERNGGLSAFGYPISNPQAETVEGHILQVQWFERDRLEIQADGSITAGRLGARLLELQHRPWEGFPKDSQTTDPSCSYFTVTGFNVCLDMLRYWASNGGLERFGYPISPVMSETIEGRAYSVQYFERRRIEIHPELVQPFNILLGLLGREVYALQGGQQMTDMLSGTTWQWTKLSDPVQQVEIQEPAKYTISFSSGSLSIKADCNQANGSYTLGQNGAISITIGGVTRAACPPGSRSDEFLQKLPFVAHYSFQNERLWLELMADGGTLEFVQ